MSYFSKKNVKDAECRGICPQTPVFLFEAAAIRNFLSRTFSIQLIPLSTEVTITYGRSQILRRFFLTFNGICFS